MDGETAGVIGRLLIVFCWLAGPFWWAVFLAGCCCIAMGGASDVTIQRYEDATPAEANTAFFSGCMLIFTIAAFSILLIAVMGGALGGL